MRENATTPYLAARFLLFGQHLQPASGLSRTTRYEQTHRRLQTQNHNKTYELLLRGTVLNLRNKIRGKARVRVRRGLRR